MSSSPHASVEHNQYAGGRFSLGLGPQVGAHITRRFGAPFDRPAERMTEFVTALRAIWRCWNEGEPLDFHGRFYRHGLMTPAFDPGPSGAGEPRVLLAAVGPRMIAAACAVADGLIAHPLTSRRVAQEQIRPRIAAAARPDFDLSCPVLVITGRSRAELDAARAAGTQADRVLRLDPQATEPPRGREGPRGSGHRPQEGEAVRVGRGE